MESVTKLRKVVLTERDLAVMTQIATQRFVSASEIAHLWSSSPKNKNHYVRLRELTQAGFVEPLVGDDGHRLGYRLTRRGIEMLPSEDLKIKARDYRSFTYRSSFDHDVLLQRVRNVIEASPLVSGYLPEHEVRKRLSEKYGRKERKDQGYKVPDALFNLRTSTRTMRVALELEISRKSESRYRKMFRELLTSSDFEIVIFITDTEKRTEALRKIISDVMANDSVVKSWPTKRGMYFATIEEILTRKQETVFVAEGTQFSLAGLEKSA
jgi:hypothetical protein